MAIIEYRKRYRRQPKKAVGAAREGEFGTGLKSAVLMSQRSLDAARQYLPSVDSGVTFSPTQHGIAARGSTGGADGIALTGGSGFSSVVPGDKNFTVMMLCRVDSLGARKFLLGDYDSGGVNESIWIEQTAGNQWRAGIVSTQPSQKVISSGVVTTGWHWVELFESGTTLELRVDDVLINTTSTTGLRRAGSDIRLMRPGAFTGLSFDGDIAACLMYEGALPASTRAAIRSNPNLAFAPQTIPVPVSAGSGSSIDLTTQNATHTHTSDNVTLTTSTTLAIDDCAHAHTSESPAPSTDTALIIADSAHAHSADNVTLSTTGTVDLVVQDATHAHTSEVPALTLESWLAIADAWHVHTSANVTLSIAGDDLSLILKILRNRQELDASTGTFRLYDDDGTTVLYQSAAWADAAGTIPYSGGVLARIDALA